MQTIKAKIGASGYEIRIGQGLLDGAGQALKKIVLSDRAVIITDTTVRNLYAGVLERSLAAAGFTVTVLEVPPGEAQKNLDTAGRLYRSLVESGAERSTTIIALGGGVIGDLAGFVAATYMRGVPLAQAPTTLLAMVDSSIGGKTAVDHAGLKNIVGVFYQPKLVIADIATLKTLPPLELGNGMAEVIKQAAISDRAFFNYLARNMEKAVALDAQVLEEIVVKNVVFKAKVVEEDEKEGGRRIILNYGHTVGHAVEAVMDFKLKHGQAVAVGMVAENEISRRLGFLSAEDAAAVKNVIEKAGLPVKLPAVDKKSLIQAMSHDKKVQQGRVRFVLLKSIGRPFVTDDVSPDLIDEVLSRV